MNTLYFRTAILIWLATAISGYFLLILLYSFQNGFDDISNYLLTVSTIGLFLPLLLSIPFLGMTAFILYKIEDKKKSIQERTQLLTLLNTASILLNFLLIVNDLSIKSLLSPYSFFILTGITSTFIFGSRHFAEYDKMRTEWENVIPLEPEEKDENEPFWDKGA
jgi:hypothetical protein